ncbi:MAG: hypothetical protein QM501_05345 [Gimesia sp.]
MSTTAAGLKALHQLYLKLHDVKQKLERGPKRVQFKEQFAALQDEKLNSAKEKVTELKRQVQQKNLDLQTNEGKILDLKGKLNSASSNKEFDIFKGQIEADTMANSVLEDEILELMEKIDAAEVEVQSWVRQRDEAFDDAKRSAQKFEADRSTLDYEIEGCMLEIADSEQIIPENERVLFQRLLRSHGAGALANVEGKFCSACNVLIEPQLRVELNSERFVFCKSCGRLLYIDGSLE